jgi:hypothetical protein
MLLSIAYLRNKSGKLFLQGEVLYTHILDSSYVILFSFTWMQIF